MGLDVHLHFQHFPMSTLIGSYANDESCLLQFAQSTLDGGLRHAYQFSIGCIRKHTVIHNCLIELLSYRVSEAVYRVRIGVYRVRSLRSSNLFEYFSQLAEVSSVAQPLKIRISERNTKRFISPKEYEAFGESHDAAPVLAATPSVLAIFLRPDSGRYGNAGRQCPLR